MNTTQNTTVKLPRFSDFDAKAYPKVLEKHLKDYRTTLNELLTQKAAFTWDNLMYPLECLEDELAKSFAVPSHLHAVMNTKALREAYQACLPMLSQHEALFYHNKALFEAIQSIETSTLSASKQKIIADSLRDFKRSGIDLPPTQQKRLEAINTRLAELANQFENHILDATLAYSLHITDESRLKGIPEHALLSAKARAKADNQAGWIFNLEAPSFIAVTTYAEDRSLRETMYEAYVTRASDVGPHGGEFDNTAIINEILSLRSEKAKLLDFSSYAALSLATKMAEDPNAVFEFIHTLTNQVLPEAKKDVDTLKAFAKAHCNIDELMPWDTHFVSQKRKEALFNINDEALRPYFPLPKVLDGAFHIVETLYGITLKDVTPSVDTWHEDVSCYGLFNAQEVCIGYIYMDLFARAHKRQGAWMDDAQSRHLKMDGAIQPPIAFLTCNFAKSERYAFPTLSHDEVITLFHELGHCLHHTLTTVDELSAAGINGVEWDAVELPSQFFENFCWQKETLQYISSHVETHEPLPHELFDALLASKQFQAGLHLIRQLEFAWFDFLLHDAYPTEGQATWIDDALNTVRATTQVLPQMPYNRFAQSFSHLFAGGYAAGYYSYLWAEVLSSDAFSKFEEEGILNPETGRAFLEAILSVGSTQKASEFFKNFRDRAPNINAFLKHHGITS